MVGISVFYFYVLPTFNSISVVQDQIFEYNAAIDEARTMNSLLAQLTADIEAIPSADRRALKTYLPIGVDQVLVQRDIKAYVDRSPTELVSILFDGGSVPVSSGEGIEARDSYTFTVTVEGEYQDILELITLLERNQYPLHAHELRIERSSGTLLQATFKLLTYAFAPGNVM